MKEIEKARIALKKQFEGLEDKKSILRAPEIRALFDGMREVEPEKRGEYGQAVNALKKEVQGWVDSAEAADSESEIEPIDVTAPWDVNTPTGNRPAFLPSELGSQHPVVGEINHICSIYERMGFIVEESREIDDDYHMFTSLNFRQTILPVTIMILL